MTTIRGFQDIDFAVEDGYLVLRQGKNLISVPANFAQSVVAKINDVVAPEPKPQPRFGGRKILGE